MPGRGTWWGGLGPGTRAALLISAIVLPLVLLCCGGVTVASLIAGVSPEGPGVSPAPPAPTEPGPPESPTDPTPSPAVEVRAVTETEEIPFEQERVDDPSLPEGTEEVRVEGRAGLKRLVYRVTITDGVETARELVTEVVVREPVHEVVATGTKPPPEPEPEPEPAPGPRCDPNYEGACVPIAPDVDCAGGGGDGPAYVRGPVRVVGQDIYDLDRDGDGVGCDT